MGSESAQSKSLDHRRFGSQRRERRNGAAALRDVADDEPVADLRVDVLRVLGECARSRRRFERRGSRSNVMSTVVSGMSCFLMRSRSFRSIPS
jgi:hypothetical protein